MALHLLHASPAAAVAFTGHRLGAAVVAAPGRFWAARQEAEIMEMVDTLFKIIRLLRLGLLKYYALER